MDKLDFVVTEDSIVSLSQCINAFRYNPKMREMVYRGKDFDLLLSRSSMGYLNISFKFHGVTDDV